MMKRRLLPALLTILLLAAPLPPLQAAEELTAKITDLSGSDYFSAVHRKFQNAKESIVVTMYLIQVFPDSSRFLAIPFQQPR